MLFRRRDIPDVTSRLRVALWPRRSWGRSLAYYAKRIPRLSGSPQAIAAGVAAGVFASFTPFIGFHFIIGFLVAFLIGGNLLASALGTSLGNPLTFPLMWASTHRLGSFILDRDEIVSVPVEVSGSWYERSFDAIAPVFVPMIIGSIPIGAAFGLLAYVISLYSVRGLQRVRRERLARRRDAYQSEQEQT